jgi:uncharacterized protein with PIN domain
LCIDQRNASAIRGNGVTFASPAVARDLIACIERRNQPAARKHFSKFWTDFGAHHCTD